jgi:hypothetical protein
MSKPQPVEYSRALHKVSGVRRHQEDTQCPGREQLLEALRARPGVAGAQILPTSVWLLAWRNAPPGVFTRMLSGYNGAGQHNNMGLCHGSMTLKLL